jgi:hypothetical protein
MKRRNVVIGLGTIVAGGGAALGTGAFSSVEAERTVSVETAGDASAFLALEDERGDNEYVEGTDDTIEITLGTNSNGDGLNQNAITTFRNLVRVTNQGTQTVDELTLQFTTTPGAVTADDTFSFPVDQADGSGTDEVEHSGAVNILTGSNSIPAQLAANDSVIFGIEVDLINGGDNNTLPANGNYTLTITANTADGG